MKLRDIVLSAVIATSAAQAASADVVGPRQSFEPTVRQATTVEYPCSDFDDLAKSDYQSNDPQEVSALVTEVDGQHDILVKQRTVDGDVCKNITASHRQWGYPMSENMVIVRGDDTVLYVAQDPRPYHPSEVDKLMWHDPKTDIVKDITPPGSGRIEEYATNHSGNMVFMYRHTSRGRQLWLINTEQQVHVPLSTDQFSFAGLRMSPDGGILSYVHFPKSDTESPNVNAINLYTGARREFPPIQGGKLYPLSSWFEEGGDVLVAEARAEWTNHKNMVTHVGGVEGRVRVSSLFSDAPKTDETIYKLKLDRPTPRR